MLTFIQMMALPEQERAAFGHPVMTVRWWDAEEVRTLTKQSWFGGLRGDLNKGAKVTLNLGVFKLEQGGVAREMSPVEQIGTVADLLEKIEPLTASEFQKALNRSISTNRFESQLVVLQGQLRPQLSKRKAVELMVGHVADYVGLETQARERFRVIREAELDACIPKLKELYELTGGNEEIGNHWTADPENLMRERVRGVDMASAGLQMNASGSVVKHLVIPLEAVKTFPHPGAFGARVLGWTEHAGNSLLLRVIALSSVYYFKEEVVPTQ